MSAKKNIKVSLGGSIHEPNSSVGQLTDCPDANVL
jgi:hypothetical protein